MSNFKFFVFCFQFSSLIAFLFFFTVCIEIYDSKTALLGVNSRITLSTFWVESWDSIKYCWYCSDSLITRGYFDVILTAVSGPYLRFECNFRFLQLPYFGRQVTNWAWSTQPTLACCLCSWGPGEAKVL